MKSRQPKTYTVHEAKTHLSQLLERVADGEDVIIVEAGVPVARLVPMILPSEMRPLGTEKRRMVVAEDFDAPLPDDVLDSFAS